MNISYVVMNGDNFAFAIPILEEVVRESEYYLEAQQRLGHIYLKLEEYEKSNEYLLRALSLDYTNLETLTFLAQNYVDLKLEKEALDIYGTLLRIDGQNQEVRRDYVGALLLFNKMDKAKEQALILVGIDTSLTNRLILSEILVSLEDFQGADRELTFIIQSEEYKDITDPIKARVLALRGWVLFKLDQKAVGYETLEESFMFSSTQAETYLYIGLIQKDNQNLVGAKQSLERAIDLDFEGDVSFFAAEEIDKLGI